jgi:hypothetical protein
MRKYATFCLLLSLAFVPVCSWAIDVSELGDPDISTQRVEYYIDQDPGRGEGTEIAFSVNDEGLAQIQFQPDIGNLPAGSHHLYIRAQNEEGDWSLPSKHSFFVQPFAIKERPGLQRVETFIGEDPGYGNGIPLVIEESAVDAKFETHITGIPQNSTSQGFFIRVQDELGNWGLPLRHAIHVTPFAVRDIPSITKAEYFIGKDPGPGNGIPIDVKGNGQERVSIPNIALGDNAHHRIGVRIADSEGNWSLPKYRSYFQLPGFPVTAIQWNLKDADGLVKQGTFPISPPAEQLKRSIDLELVGGNDLLHRPFTLSANLVLLGKIPTQQQTLDFSIEALFDPLDFLNHPQNVNVIEGQTISFSAEVRGNPPVTYQWLKNGEPIVGAVTSMLSISAASLADAGVYALVATDAYGAKTSEVAVVQVEVAGPVITAHPADRNEDMVMSIEEVTAYGAAWKRSDSWPVEPNPIPIAYVTRAGALWKGGETYRVTPGISEPPLWWVNTSPTPRFVRQSMSTPTVVRSLEELQVDIEIVPSGATRSYAFEERVPEGWTISSISAQGQWIPETNSIRWGPFLDHQARVLSYEIQSSTVEPELKQLIGRFSADGVDHIIHAAGMRRSVETLPSLSFDSRTHALRISGTSGETYVLQATETLGSGSWENVTKVDMEGEQMIWKDPNGTEHTRRFYRLVHTGTMAKEKK